MVYTDTIIPETQQMYDSMMRQWGLHDEGYYLKADFSHLPALQVDEMAKAETMKLRAETLEKLQTLGLDLDEDEIRLITGIEIDK